MPRAKIIITVILSGLLIGLLVYAYRPSAVVARSLEQLAQAHTGDFTAQLNMANSASTKQLLGEEGAVDVTFGGQWERREGPDSIATGITLVTQTESVSITIQGEARLIDDKLYLQIQKAPPAIPLLVKIKDAWIVINRGADAQDTPSIELDPQLFSSIKREGVETINDVSTVHYSATATNESVVNFMDALADILGTNLSTQQVKQIRDSMANVTSIPIDVWVKRWGSQPTQLRTTLAVPGGTTVQFTLTLNELNQPVTIEAPGSAAPFEEVLK